MLNAALLTWTALCVLTVIRISIMSRIDDRAIKMVHDQNLAWLEKNKRNSVLFDDGWIKFMTDRYDRVNGFEWRNILNLTQWTLKQRYPWLFEPLEKENIWKSLSAK